ncbi:MAG: ankyrin repeat domain-containing protein [Armatimonadetes bacterium]|nr:ankyrin repeat domain-containing protein [Armatimonadota bacterium]
MSTLKHYLAIAMCACFLMAGCTPGGQTSDAGRTPGKPTPEVPATPEGVDLSDVPGEAIRDFHKALEDGDDEKVKQLLAQHPKLPHTRGEHNRTALQSGSSKVSIETLEALVQGGCPVNTGFQESGGWTALHRAAYAGNVEHIKFFLENGAEVDAIGKMDRETALHEAAEYGHIDVVKALLEGGADPTLTTRMGRNALEVARWYDGKNEGDHAAVIAHLEEVMKTAQPKPDSPVSPDSGLTYAASYGDLEKVKAAVEAEPRVVFGYEQGGGGTTLLVIAAGSSKHDETVPVVAYLLEKGSDIHADDNGGRTALHRAAMEGNAQVIEMLLKAGADLEAVDNDGRTPLFFAKDPPTTQLLLDKGAKLDAVDARGETVLELADDWGYAEKVKFLEERSAPGSSPTP